jgi:hypothetical protein
VLITYQLCVCAKRAGEKKSTTFCVPQQNLLNTFEYILLLLGERTSVISHCCFLLQLGPSIKTKTAGSSFIHFAAHTKSAEGETSAVRGDSHEPRNFDRCFCSAGFNLRIKFNGSFNLTVRRVIWLSCFKSGTRHLNHNKCSTVES